MKQTNAQLLSRVKELEGLVKAQLAQSNKQAAKLESNKITISSLGNQVDEAENIMKGLFNERDKLRADVAPLHAAVREKDKTIEGLSVHIEKCNSAINSLNCQLDEAIGSRADLKAEIDGLTATLADRRTYIEQLHAQDSGKDETIAELSADNAELKKGINGWCTINTELQKEVAFNKRTLTTAAEQINELTAEIVELKAKAERNEYDAHVLDMLLSEQEKKPIHRIENILADLTNTERAFTLAELVKSAHNHFATERNQAVETANHYAECLNLLP